MVYVKQKDDQYDLIFDRLYQLPYELTSLAKVENVQNVTRKLRSAILLPHIVTGSNLPGAHVYVLTSPHAIEKLHRG